MGYTSSIADVLTIKSYISYIVKERLFSVAEYFVLHSENLPNVLNTALEEELSLTVKDQIKDFLDQILVGETTEEVYDLLVEKGINYVKNSGLIQPGVVLLQSLNILEEALKDQLELYVPEAKDQLKLYKKLSSFFNGFESKILNNKSFTFTEYRSTKGLTESLIRNSIDGILAFDNTLKITEFNPALEVITGKRREDVIGKKVEEVLPYVKQSGEIKFYEQVLKGLSLMVPEVCFKIPESHKSGYYNANYTPVINGSGVISGGLVVLHEITKRKKVEEKLKQQKQFSESLINNSIDGVFAFNCEYKCTTWNPQMEVITGIVKNSALGRNTSSLFSVKEFQPKKLENVLQGEIIYLENFQFVNNNQRFEVFIIPVYSVEKSITGGLVIAHNITERTRAEEALRELSESLKHTVEGISIVNREGNFVSANKALAKLVDVSVSDLLNTTWQSIISKEDLELVEDALEKVKKENSASFEVRINNSKKLYVYCEITIVPYQDKNGSLKGYHFFFRDISERKIVENRFIRSEALLIEAQELARMGSFEYGVDSGDMFWSDEIFRLFGLKPKEIKPDFSTFYALLPEDAKQVISNTWENIFKSYKPCNFEHRIVLPNNHTKIIYGHAKPVLDTNGDIIKITGYIQDITERKEAEKVLKEAYEELKKAEENLVKVNLRLENRVRQRTEELSKKNKELHIKNEELLKINSDLDNFVYTASHDLRSPISNIEGLINTLTEELKTSKNSDFDILVEMINVCINKFKITIKDLTEITKIQKNLDEDVSLISVEELIGEVKYDINHLFEQAGATLETEIEKKDIKFSRKNLRSIFYNLISNGIKYRSLDRAPVISVKVEEQDDWVVISVKDNGLGIDIHQKDKIFRMFKRMHNHVEGTGIGLYIVKRIIENSGGKVEVDSEVGRGTEFKVFLKA